MENYDKQKVNIKYRTDYKGVHNQIHFMFENDKMMYSFEGNGSFYLLGIERLKGKFLNVYESEDFSNEVLRDEEQIENILEIQKQLKPKN